MNSETVAQSQTSPVLHQKLNNISNQLQQIHSQFQKCFSRVKKYGQISLSLHSLKPSSPQKPIDHLWQSLVQTMQGLIDFTATSINYVLKQLSILEEQSIINPPSSSFKNTSTHQSNQCWQKLYDELLSNSQKQLIDLIPHDLLQILIGKIAEEGYIDSNEKQIYEVPLQFEVDVSHSEPETRIYELPVEFTVEGYDEIRENYEFSFFSNLYSIRHDPVSKETTSEIGIDVNLEVDVNSNKQNPQEQPIHSRQVYQVPYQFEIVKILQLNPQEFNITISEQQNAEIKNINNLQVSDHSSDEEASFIREKYRSSYFNDNVGILADRDQLIKEQVLTPEKYYELVQKNIHMEQTIEELGVKLKAKEQQVDHLKCKIQKIEELALKSRKQEEGKWKHLRQQIDKYEEKLQDMAMENQMKEQQNSELVFKLSQIQDSNQSFQEYQVSLKNQLDVTNEEMIQGFQRLNMRIEELEIQITEKDDQIQSLTYQLNQVNKMMKLEHTILEDRNKQLIITNDTLQIHNFQLNDQIENIKLQYKEAMMTIEEYEESALSLYNLNFQNQHRNPARRSNNNSRTNKSMARLERIDKENAYLKKQLANSLQELSEAKQEIKVKQQALENFKQQIQELRSALTNNQHQQYNTEESYISQLQNLIMNYEQMITENLSTIQGLQEDLYGFISDGINKQKENENLHADILQLSLGIQGERRHKSMIQHEQQFHKTQNSVTHKQTSQISILPSKDLISTNLNESQNKISIYSYLANSKQSQSYWNETTLSIPISKVKRRSKYISEDQLK